jgi:hypothetical protein
MKHSLVLNLAAFAEFVTLWSRYAHLAVSTLIGSLTSGSASADGKIAYRMRDSNDAIYQSPISERGQKLGPTFHLPAPTPHGRDHQASSDLSVARDKILIDLPQVHSEIWMPQSR